MRKVTGSTGLEEATAKCRRRPAMDFRESSMKPFSMAKTRYQKQFTFEAVPLWGNKFTNQHEKEA